MATNGGAPPLLAITPGGIHFGEVALGATAPLRLAAAAGDAAAGGVAFKIKTTRPTRYCVRPNTGVVGGGLAVAVDVEVCVSELPDVGGGGGGSAGGLGRDKFLVQAARVPDGWAGEELGGTFWGAAAATSYKLRVSSGAGGGEPSRSGDSYRSAADAADPPPSTTVDAAAASAAAAAAATSAAAAAIAAAAATASAASAAEDLRRRQAVADAQEAQLTAALTTVRADVVGARGELARLVASTEVAAAAAAARVAAPRGEGGGGAGGGAASAAAPAAAAAAAPDATAETAAAAVAAAAAPPFSSESATVDPAAPQAGGVSFGVLAALCGVAAVAAKVAL